MLARSVCACARVRASVCVGGGGCCRLLLKFLDLRMMSDYLYKLVGDYWERHKISRSYLFHHNRMSFWVRLQNCKMQLLALSCLSVHMDHLGSHWTDFDEVWYMSFFQKSVEKIQVLLKSDSNMYFTRRHFHRRLTEIFLDEKCFK
jgi:hypothetical protein